MTSRIRVVVLGGSALGVLIAVTHVTYRQPDPKQAADLFAIMRDTLEAEDGDGMVPHVFPDPRFEASFLGYLFRDPSGQAWAAEAGSYPVGFGCSVVRGKTRWLVFLYVLPEFQGRGVGGELYDRCMRGWQGTAATMVDASSPAATALYMHRGLLPQVCVSSLRSSLPFEGPGDGPALRRQPGEGEERIAALDAEVWGGGRPFDHAFWRAHGFTFRTAWDEAGGFLGYAYWAPTGCLGPVAATSQDGAVRIVESACREMDAAGLVPVTALVPASNRACLVWMLNHGFRPQGMEIAMSNGPFGDWSRCLVHRAGLP